MKHLIAFIIICNFGINYVEAQTAFILKNHIIYSFDILKKEIIKNITDKNDTIDTLFLSPDKKYLAYTKVIGRYSLFSVADKKNYDYSSHSIIIMDLTKGNKQEFKPNISDGSYEIKKWTDSAKLEFMELDGMGALPFYIIIKNERFEIIKKY